MVLQQRRLEFDWRWPKGIVTHYLGTVILEQRPSDFVEQLAALIEEQWKLKLLVLPVIEGVDLMELGVKAKLPKVRYWCIRHMVVGFMTAAKLYAPPMPRWRSTDEPRHAC
jgi:hypothetical protein